MSLSRAARPAGSLMPLHTRASAPCAARPPFWSTSGDASVSSPVLGANEGECRRASVALMDASHMCSVRSIGDE
eukprot:2698297-Prymnesium_polylepis.1